MDIGLLGPLTVDGAAVDFPRRDRVVLAALALKVGEDLTAERLADALWRDELPASWVKVLQGCVVRLRKALGSATIRTVPHGYRLEVPADQVDAVRFERLLLRGRELLTLGEPDRAAYVLGEALTLWRGPALTELEAWEPGRLEAGRLEELRLDAEELRLEAAIRTGRHRETLGAARASVEHAPLRERRWALLALAQYQSGRQADALRTLGEARTMLATELGLDPGPDLVSLEDAIRRQDPTLVATAAAPEVRPACPYRGLVPYDVADAEDFYGRDRDVAACRERLAAVGAVTVVGPSGSGKSSLARAGIAAGLVQDGHRVVVITPGPHPLEALTAVRSSGPHRALVVDQCEEAVGLCADQAERAAFFAALSEYAERALLVVAVRADRLGDLTGHAGFTRLVERSLYLLDPMTRDDLVAAIEGPAAGAGLRLEPGLVDLLVREVEGEPGALPLLSHALRSTWELREANTLTVAGYRATGGVRGAVAQTAEAVYEHVPPDQRPALRDLLLRLVAPSPEGAAMRSRIPRRLVAGSPHHEALIETLVAARLVTSDEDVIELAHEALVRAWPRLKDWLDDDAEGQRTLRHLVVAADSWEAMQRPDSELYRGARLAKTLEWASRAQPELTPSERDFLEAGRLLSQAEQRAAAQRVLQQRRVNRRLRGLLVGVALLTAGALLAAWVALDQSRASSRQRDEAVSQRNAAAALALAAASRDVADLNGALALALAAESGLATPEPLLQATGALAKARLVFDTSPAQPLRGPLVGHTEPVTSLAFSPDGGRLASAAADAVRIWDLGTGDPAASVLPGTEKSYAVAFRARGELVATGGQSGLRVWDAAGRTFTERLHPWSGKVLDVSFSPDGRRLASAGGDGAIRIWDPATGRQLGAALKVHGNATSVAFNADGRRLASTDARGWIWEWNPQTGRVLQVHRALRFCSAYAVAYHPDGRLLASAGYPCVHFWDVRTGNLLETRIRERDGFFDIALSPDGRVGVASGPEGVQLFEAEGHDRSGTPLPGAGSDVSAVAFSPGGDLFATAGFDGAVRLWHLMLGRPDPPVLRLRDVEALAFSPDGNLLASIRSRFKRAGGVDLWDPTSLERIGRELPSPRGATALAFDPRGGILAVADFNGIVRFWDPTTGRQVAKPVDPVGRLVYSLAFSPDGRVLATAGAGGVRLWDPAKGTPVGDLLRHRRSAYSVSFSPDGRRIVTTGLDGRVRLWDPKTGEQVGRELPYRQHAFWAGFSPAGDMLATVGDDGVRLWDPVSGGLRASTQAGGTATASASSVAFSPDGRLVATAGSDGIVRLWDPSTGDPVGGPLPGHQGVVRAMAFSPRGHLLATTGDDHTVRLWDWDMADACEAAAAYVARGQLEPYLPEGWEPACPYGE